MLKTDQNREGNKRRNPLEQYLPSLQGRFNLDIASFFCRFIDLEITEATIKSNEAILNIKTARDGLR